MPRLKKHQRTSLLTESESGNVPQKFVSEKASDGVSEATSDDGGKSKRKPLDLPTPQQWEQLHAILTLLGHVKETSVRLQADTAVISDIIPLFLMLKRKINSYKVTGLGTFQEQLVEQLQEYSHEVFNDDLPNVATCLIHVTSSPF